MKKAKKLLSFFLAITMLLSCIAVGMGGIVALAANVTVTNVDEAIIAVPETVYMTPSTDKSTIGQYYVNNTVTSGSYELVLEANNANTNGYVQFYVPGAKDVTIAVNTVTDGIGDIILAEAGSTSGTYENASLGALIGADGYFAYNTVGLYISGTGITAGNTALAEWVFTFTMNDGSVRIYYAYTTLYAPYYQPVGAAARADAGYRDTYASSILWVSGVHGYTDGSRGSSYYVQTANFLPMFGTIKTPNNNNPDTNWIQSSSNGLSPTMSYTSYSTSNGGWNYYHTRANAISPTATLTVDISRYNNFNQIPNFKVGFMITDQAETTSADCAWYVSDYTGNTSGYNNDTAHSSSKYTSEYNSQGSVIKSASGRGMGDPVYNDPWNKTISGTASFRIKSAVKSYHDAAITTTAWNNNFVDISVTGANKATLRQLVLQGTSLNANNYTSASWSTYQSALRAAAEKLGDPENSSVDTLALEDALKALQTTITLHGNGGSLTATSEVVTIGAATSVNVTPTATGTRTGYTFNNWSTSATAASGASTVSVSLYNRNLYAIWDANNYSISYDNIFSMYDFGNNSTVLTASKPEFVTVDYDDSAKSITLTSDANAITEAIITKYGTEANLCDIYTSYNANGYIMTVKPSTEYYLFYDVTTNGCSHQAYVFGYTDAMAGDNFTGESYPHKSMGASGRTFTTGENTTKLQIRVGTVGSRNAVATFSNIRIVEKTAYDSYIATINYAKANNEKVYEYADNGTYGALLEPARTGYTFKGWFTEPNGQGEQITENTTNTAYSINVYSHWSEHTYTIAFNANGGTGSVDSMTNILFTSSVSLNSASTISREGFVFLGWSTNASATAATYTDGATVSKLAGHNSSGETITLYAVWQITNEALTEDVIVLDFDKPVTFNPLENDTILLNEFSADRIDSYTFRGLSEDENGATYNTALEGAYGSFSAVVENNTVSVTYTPSKVLDGIDTVYYVISVSANGDVTNIVGAINIAPASNVLYEEDNFTVPDTDAAKTGVAWGTVGTAGTASQTTDSNIYGYDTVYNNNIGKYSNDSALKVTVDSTNKRAQIQSFTFSGTGFDLYGQCGPDTGVMIVTVKNGDEVIKASIVDTYYNDSAYETLNQVPIVSYSGASGTYTVQVSSIYLASAGAVKATQAQSVMGFGDMMAYSAPASGAQMLYEALAEVGMEDVFEADDLEVIWFDDDSVFNGGYGADTYADAQTDSTSTASALTSLTCVIDSIRVYNPIETDWPYVDSEQGAQYSNVISNLVSGNLTNGSGTFAYIEGETYETVDFATYAEKGPKNEFYLAPATEANPAALIFTVGNITDGSKIMISLRAASGTPKVKINNVAYDVTSSTEMYYDITEYVGADGTVTIQNVGDGLLAIDNLKVTGAVAVMSTFSLMTARRMMAAPAEEVVPNTPEETPEVEDTTPDTGTDSDTSTQESTEEIALSEFINKIVSFIRKIINSITSLFGI